MANEKRLIDANALISNLRTFKGLGRMVAETLVRFTEKQPTVDAEEVVRCKDCKHYKPQNQGAHRNCTTPYCTRVVALKVSPEGFCSFGERREGE